jgi:NAD(P)-dependent dehydrogenase (short-subunit alcohol dehydrogenase family)
MKGKTAVITGGTSGIGEIAGERLAQMGAWIGIVDI